MFPAFEKYRIDILSALILAALTLAAGISVYVVMQRQAESLLSGGFKTSLQKDVHFTVHQIHHVTTEVQVASNHPSVIKNLQLFISKPGNSTGRVELQELAKSFMATNFTGLSIYDASGHEVARAGHFSQRHDLRVPLKIKDDAFLLWDGEFILQISKDVLNQQGRRVGLVMAEIQLPHLTLTFADIAAIGKTGEFAVCAPLADDEKNMDCFLSRISGKDFKRLARVVEGKPLPMHYALNGATGILFTTDYRREQLIAAYTPVGQLGLGMVMKIDQAELFQPVVKQLKFIALVLAALVMVGMLLLNFLVKPIVRKLVDSERATRAANTLLGDSEARFASGEKYLRTIVDAALDAVISMNEKGMVSDWNPEAERIFGYSRADAVGKPLHSLIIPPPLREAHQNGLKHFLKSGVGPVLGKRIEITAMRADGGEFPIEMSIVVISSGESFFFNAFLRDITERKRIEEDISQLNTELSQFKNTLDQTLEGIFMFDLESLRFTYVNQGARRKIGYSETELMQMTPLDIKPESTLEQFRQLLQPLIDGVQSSLTYQTVHRHKDGHDIPVEVFLQLVHMEGQAPRFVAMVSDISARKQAEEQIEFLAFHDALTQLPNRLLAKNHLQQAVLAAERENTKVALLFIDLDNFKTINDSLGHVVGDGLLKAVAVRLRECLRDTDTLSRQGGDEFLIVLNNVCDTESITVVVEKILGRIAEPFELDQHELAISLSIGIAVYPDDGKDFDTLLKQSDTAMYQAKDSGRNTYRFHTEQMNIDAVEHLRMRNGLRRALEHGEFVLHYQPQISLASGAVIGAEALIRWNHPELGLVAPGRFISVAEDTGLIVPMGEWVLREACRQSLAWRKAGLPELVMAVNLSAVQFKRGDVLKSVTQALAESGLEPALLELELTESILIKDTEKVLATVRQLKSLGVKLSIDDFGTGYSSLSYLKQFDVDKLKIDQSFVRDMVDDPNDAAIVRAIIQMAKGLNLTAIAEGVEDERQLALLRLQHCDEVQGYHFARPMPADQFESFMSRFMASAAK